MSKRIVGLHLLGWIIAIVILLISLFSAAKLGTDRDANASGRGFYWTKEILPDHVLYPFLMVIDRVALETTHDPAQRIYMQVNYAHRRLISAQLLADKQKNSLALTTLTKAQKYLSQAAQDALTHQVSIPERRMVIKAIENQDQLAVQLAPHFTTYDQGVLNQLRSESKILAEKLANSIQ
jgi:hypothetical protein